MTARAQERILINPDEIRRWAEERGAVPTRVKGTGGLNDVGILRLHFPEYSQDDENLEEISWDEFFFDEFDRKRLALLVEDRTPDGKRSNFNKIISRATIEDFVKSSSLSGPTQARRSTRLRSRTGVTSSASRNRRSTAKEHVTRAGSQKRPGRSSRRSDSRRRAA